MMGHHNESFQFLIYKRSLPTNTSNASSEGFDIVVRYDYRNTTNVVVLVIASLVVTALNLAVVVAFFRDRKLRRRPANVLICSQAAIDMLIGGVFLPSVLIEAFLEKQALVPYLIYYFLFVSLFNLMGICADRFLALSMPFFHHRAVDKSRTKRFLFLIWSLPVLMTLVPFFWAGASVEQRQKNLFIYITVSWCFMLVIFNAMAVIYFVMIFVARRIIKKRRQQVPKKSFSKKLELARKEVRVIHLFGLLLIFFLCAYLPILYMNLCDIIGRVDLIPVVMEGVSLYSLVINSLVNPLLCIYLKYDYCRAFVKMLGVLVLREKVNGESTHYTDLYSSRSTSNYTMKSLRSKESKKQLVSPSQISKNLHNI